MEISCTIPVGCFVSWDSPIGEEALGAVDTHQHLWDLDRVSYPWLTEDWGELYGSHSPSDLYREMEKAGVDRAILVQSANSFDDTDFLLEQAERFSWIVGVVGWLPLNDPESFFAGVDHYRENPFFKGIRHMIHAEPKPTWLFQESIIKNLTYLAKHGYSFDVVAVLPEHLLAVSVLSEKIPDLRIVIDHLGSPPVSTGEFDRWAGYLSIAAESESVYVKASGLGTLSGNPDSWDENDIQRYMNYALEKFGVSRIMIGGDWPICNLAGGYAKAWNIYRNVLSDLSSVEKQMILETNPYRFYRIQNHTVKGSANQPSPTSTR